MQITFDAYRQRLAQLTKHPKVAAFLRWWLTELKALLPAQWHSSGVGFSDAVVVRLGPADVRVNRVESSRLVDAGSLDLKSTGASDQRSAFRALLDRLPGGAGKVVLGIPDESILLKKMHLPLAVEENLENVLAFEMDRHTPFKADQVYFDYRIVHRDVQNHRMELEIAVAPRDAVDRSVTQLSSLGVVPIAVAIVEKGVLNEFFNLLPRTRRPQPASLLGRRNAGLLALVLVLAMGALLLPIVIKREAVLQLMPVVERAKNAAEATDDLHRKLDALAAQHNFLLEKKQSSPVLVVLFDELTRILPDDTWVQQFDLKGKELQVMGETGSSSKLIGLMEQSKILHDSNFRSPLTKGQNPSSERFHLGAEVKPLPVGVATSVAPQQNAASGAELAPPPSGGPTQQEGEAARNTPEPKPLQTRQENG